MDRASPTKRLMTILIALLAVALVVPVTASAQGNWWDVVPEVENPSPYYDSILYSEIAPRLREIEMTSNRVKVEVIGQSAGGRNLFLVTIADPQAMGRLSQYKAISNQMVKDPAKAQEMIEKFGDFKVPVFINGSIHGGEYPGTDTAMRLIEQFAYSNDPEVLEVLENEILLINVCQNPDGRVAGTRDNANGIDINRDFYTQSQPESRITAGLLADWNPMILLDLHGFVDPMLIEPCTPPHNPNYEYDLYIKWALAQAEAMEANLFVNTGFLAQIPYRDFDLGWDDWPPSYTPMFAMYHGAYGHTLETPYRDYRGVEAQYHAVWGALRFVVQNRADMLNDQIEIFRRGYLDLPQQPVPPELVPEWEQYPELMLQEFPAAWVIPKGAPFQVSPHQAARLVDFLLYNDVDVEQSTGAFTVDGVTYPAGTYVVWMDQPKRGLANVILDDGLDLSGIPGLFFYSPPSTWSNPLLWGTRRVMMEDEVAVSTRAITKADDPRGSSEGGKAAAYAYLPTSISAVQATNELLARGVAIKRVETPFTDSGRSFGAGAVVIPATPALANELATKWALDVFALKSVPAGAVPLTEQKIALYQSDTGPRNSLRRLGFAFTELRAANINAGELAAYDVFINQGLRWTDLNAAGKASFSAWYADGGDYVALCDRGRAIDFANAAGITSVTYGYIDGNAIVTLDNDPNNTIAAGYAPDGHAFVYRSAWFKTWDGMEVASSIGDDAFLKSGFWPNWPASGAAGMPIVLHKKAGDSDVTLIGLDATFRAHPEESFRLIANAIYTGAD